MLPGTTERGRRASTDAGVAYAEFIEGMIDDTPLWP